MKYVILGTAGHIDHGKTSLIKALTGIDTDRLKEEKERGITIELGFAHFVLPNGIRVGIVDVPGHERFVHHMVSGATGMDMVALLVAADEGVMPQTREHLDICRLLNIPRGLVVLTKIDLVDDPDWLELVKEDIREAVRGTFLEGSPIVAVSARTGEGLEDLIRAISDIAVTVPERPSSGPFRLPVDRVFTMKGFGTVVTGTSNTGKLHVNDPLMIYPSLRPTRARSLQSHGEPVEEVGPGMRTAINLQGVEKSEVKRGDVIAPPDALIPTNLIDVELLLLPSAPRKLKHGDRVRFHTGTVEIIATVALLGTDRVAPGDTAYAQLILDEPTVVIAQDRFVIRSYSPVVTIGGGTILNPLPRKHKRKGRLRASVELKALSTGTITDRITWHVRSAGYEGITLRELEVRTACFAEELRTLVGQLEQKGELKVIDRERELLISAESVHHLKANCLEKIRDYHKRYPLKPGIPRELLHAELNRTIKISPEVFAFVIGDLADSGEIILQNDLIKHREHSPSLTPEQEKIRATIESIYARAGLHPPYFKEVAEGIPGTDEEKRALLDWMINQEVLIRVKDELIFHNSAIEDLKNRLISFLREKGRISTGEFKELAGTSRKYAIPLLEYFDRTRVTLRIGDERRLRKNESQG